MNTFMDTLQFFIIITAELTVLFLGISTLVALALMYIPREKLQQWLSRRGLWGNFLGAVVGSLTPFCACSTIPMTLGMLKAGAPFGPIMSFVIASPLLNPVIIIMVATLMGLEACLLYFSVTFLGSMLFGAILEQVGGAQYVRQAGNIAEGCCSESTACCSDDKGKAGLSELTMQPSAGSSGSCCSGETSGGGLSELVLQPATFSGKLKKAFLSAWGDFRGVLVFLLIGVALGAAIYGYIPQDFIVEIAGPDNPFAIPVAALIGVPLYIRAETAIPIGLALSQKGMSMGAVIALIIGGAGMAIPEMSMLAGIFRKRLVGAIAGVVFLTAVAGGYAFNLLF